MSTISSGRYFGEMALLTGGLRKAWVPARSYTVCTVIPKTAIERAMDVYPKAVTILVKNLQRAFKKLSTGVRLGSGLTLRDLAKRLRGRFQSHADLMDVLQYNDADGRAESVLGEIQDASVRASRGGCRHTAPLGETGSPLRRGCS